MRKFPPEHYPNPGVQHTIATVAIGLGVAYFTEAEKGRVSPGMKRTLKAMQRWNEDCAQQTRKRSDSRAAIRGYSMLASFFDSEEYRSLLASADRDYSLATMLWTVLTFIEDVRAVCPLYWDGEMKQAWRNYYSVVNRLAEKQRLLFPDMDEVGTTVYERAYDAIMKG